MNRTCSTYSPPTMPFSSSLNHPTSHFPLPVSMSIPVHNLVNLAWFLKPIPWPRAGHPCLKCNQPLGFHQYPPYLQPPTGPFCVMSNLPHPAILSTSFSRVQPLEVSLTSPSTLSPQLARSTHGSHIQCPSLLWPALPAQEKYPWALARTLFTYSPDPQGHSIPYATFSTSILQTQTRNHILYTSPVPSVPNSTLPKPFPTSSPNLPSTSSLLLQSTLSISNSELTKEAQ